MATLQHIHPSGSVASARSLFIGTRRKAEQRGAMSELSLAALKLIPRGYRRGVYEETALAARRLQRTAFTAARRLQRRGTRNGTA
eukprot:8611752-Alexandrium_andersonii.AAC.1